MPKDIEFEGSGRKGFDFEEKGYQERNLNNLLKSLSKKKTQEAIKDLSEIEPESWFSMVAITEKLTSGIGGGTDLSLLSDLKDDLTSIIKTELEYALAPLKNEFNDLINTALEPFMPFLTNIFNWLGGILGDIGGAIRDGFGLFDPEYKEENLPRFDEYMFWLSNYVANYYITHPWAGPSIPFPMTYHEWIAANPLPPPTNPSRGLFLSDLGEFD